MIPQYRVNKTKQQTHTTNAGVRKKEKKKGVFPSGFLFSFSFFFKKTSVALLKLWEVTDFANLGTPVPKKSYHHLGLSPMRPNEL